jgi:hypothetical protein
MKVVETGCSYELAAGCCLSFVRSRVGGTARPGTTNEEVIEVLLDRIIEAYQHVPSRESALALHFLRRALAAFQLRTSRRVYAHVEGTRLPHAYVPETVRGMVRRTPAPEVEYIEYAAG